MFFRCNELERFIIPEHGKNDVADFVHNGQVEKSISVFYPNWNRQKFADMLRKFHIAPTKKVKELSKGMQMKLVGFLVTLLLLSKMPAIGNSIISVIESSPILLVFLAVFAIVVMYTVSIILSIRIMKK